MLKLTPSNFNPRLVQIISFLGSGHLPNNQLACRIVLELDSSVVVDGVVGPQQSMTWPLVVPKKLQDALLGESYMQEICLPFCKEEDVCYSSETVLLERNES